MKKSVSILVFAVMAIFGASVFAAGGKVVMGLNSVQDTQRSADSERAIKKLESQVSAALLKVGKFTVITKSGTADLKDAAYLLDLNLIEYTETVMNVKKMMQKDAKYAVEVKLLDTSNNQIIVQDTIKGSCSSDKVPLGSPTLPDVYATAMQEVANKISDKIIETLFKIEVLKVTEGGIITIPNYGFAVGDVFNVYRIEVMTNQDGDAVASEDVLVCAIAILEVSGSTARAMIPSTVKAYKKYAKEVVEVGMICKRSNDEPIDQKSLAGLIKKMQKAK